MNKELRKKQVLKRKNFLPLLIITSTLWIIVGVIVYFADPGLFGIIPAFFLTVFAAFFLTFSTILESSRRGLIVAAALVLFLFLRLLQIGNIINFLLIVGVAIATDRFFLKK